MLTIEEVKKALREVDDWYEFCQEGGGTSLGEVKIVDYKEGQDWVQNVFLLKSHNFYFSLSGSYNSYEGTEWEDVSDIVQVFPHVITKKVYKKEETISSDFDIKESLPKFKYKAGMLFLPEGEQYYLSNNILTRIK